MWFLSFVGKLIALVGWVAMADVGAERRNCVGAPNPLVNVWGMCSIIGDALI